MSMFNLLEYSGNCFMTSGSCWNYSRDEIDNINHVGSNGKLFTYETKIIGKAEARSAQGGNEGDKDQPP